MTSTRNKLLDDIFSEALGLSPAARTRFLDDRCGTDEELREEIETLIAASESDSADDRLAARFGSIRESLFRSMLSEDEETEESLSGRRVGNWLVGERIARGGLATVYRAARADGTFEQAVAFKVMRRGLDTDDLVSRFRAERQILSALEHPSIAQILDGGALDDGRPYLVLEYIDGLPITEHCAKTRAGTRDCVVLLIEVLRALHHAHQRLVVHRDVKPSNILVSGDGNVTLLDFGIAKLLDPLSMPGASTLTRTGVSLLTPGYGSPEQQAGEAVTTASDIYQAGIVMYELLTGTRPFTDAAARDDRDAPLPSRALGKSPRAREVRGDLDAITRKAMHADPAHRYTSAGEMIADLKRYLDGLPVAATPDSVRYRLAKLSKRKPWLIPGLVLLTLGVAAYVTTLTVYSTQLAHEQQVSAASQQFLIDLFRSPDPFSPADPDRGRNITVVEALDIGRRRIGSELAGQPDLRASLLRTMSEVYQSLDANRAATELREDALDLERELYGERSPQVVASMRVLGGLYGGGGQMDRADRMLHEQLSIAADIFGRDSPELGLSEIAVGMQAMRSGDPNKGEALLQSGVAKLRQQTGTYARDIIEALISSVEKNGMESKDIALDAIREAEAIAVQAYGDNSLQAASARIRLASTLSMFGDYEDAERRFLEAIPVLEAHLGKDHGSTMSAQNNLGYLYVRSGAHERAERIYRELLDRQLAIGGSVHRSVADSSQNLAGVLGRQNRYDEALPLHRQAYDIYKTVLNDDNYVIAYPLLSIAYAELQRGHGTQAETSAREALRIFEASVPDTYLEGVARCLVGLSLEQQGRTAEGSALVEASHALIGTGSVPDPYPALCRLPRG